MRIKRSFYNIEFKEVINGKEEIFIYNTFSSALANLNEEIYNLYTNIDSISNENKLSNEVLETIETMKMSGFVVDESLDELKRVEILSNMARFSSKTLGITIAPTLNCNMICPYCFEDKKAWRMDATTKLKLINFVENKIKQSKSEELSISWYGGEPLLEKETIIELSEKFIQLCNENEIKYKASMISNGFLLDTNTAKILRDKCRVDSVQITIDGLKEVHNKRRKLINNGDSFTTIIENIDNCKDILNVVVRVNIDKDNLDNIKSLIDYLMVEKEFKEKIKISFAPVINNISSCNSNLNNCFTSEEFVSIENKLFNYMYEKKYITLDKFEPIALSVSCAAIGLNYYVVDPQGDLYTCWSNVGLKKISIGNLTTGTELESNYINWLSVKYPEKCKECRFLPICQSGCPYNIVHNNKPECDYKAMNLIELLKIKCRQG